MQFEPLDFCCRVDAASTPMDDDVFDAVHAIIARNDALARDSVDRRLADLIAHLLIQKGLNSSGRWIAKVGLLEEEGRKFATSTSGEVDEISHGSQAFAILEEAIQSFNRFLDEAYINEANKGQGLARTVLKLQRTGDFIADLWRPVRQRLDNEIAVSRAEFSRRNKEQRQDQRVHPCSHSIAI